MRRYVIHHNDVVALCERFGGGGRHAGGGFTIPVNRFNGVIVA